MQKLRPSSPNSQGKCIMGIVPGQWKGIRPCMASPSVLPLYCHSSKPITSYFSLLTEQKIIHFGQCPQSVTNHPSQHTDWKHQQSTSRSRSHLSFLIQNLLKNFTEMHCPIPLVAFWFVINIKSVHLCI